MIVVSLIAFPEPWKMHTPELLKFIGLYANSDKTDSMYFKQDISTSTLKDKIIRQFPIPRWQYHIYGSRCQHDIGNASTAINRLSIMWKSNLFEKIKRKFFQAGSLMFYGCTNWTTGRRNLDAIYTGTLRAVLNKSWKQHPRKQPLYGNSPPISESIRVRSTRHAEYCRDELISDDLLFKMIVKFTNILVLKILLFDMKCLSV